MTQLSLFELSNQYMLKVDTDTLKGYGIHLNKKRDGIRYINRKVILYSLDVGQFTFLSKSLWCKRVSQTTHLWVGIPKEKLE